MNTYDYDSGVIKTEAIDFANIRLRMTRDLLETLMTELEAVQASCVRIDAIKKKLFYGNHSSAKDVRSEIVSGLGNNNELRMLHGLLGLLTETSEMIEGMHLTLDQEMLMNPDYINVSEEIGDILWYASILCNASGSSMDEAMRRNLAKLGKRFGAKFTSERALNRDIDGERDTLEKK